MKQKKIENCYFSRFFSRALVGSEEESEDDAAVKAGAILTGFEHSRLKLIGITLFQLLFQSLNRFTKWVQNFHFFKRSSFSGVVVVAKDCYNLLQVAKEALRVADVVVNLYLYNEFETSDRGCPESEVNFFD